MAANCHGPGGSPDGAGTDTPVTSYANHALIGPAGGKLIHDIDGRQIEIDIPRNALAEPTTITAQLTECQVLCVASGIWAPRAPSSRSP